MSEGKGIIKGIFETQFEVFITPQIIKFLYLLSMIILFVVGVGAIITGFSEGVGQGLVALIVSIPVYLLVLLYLRVICEFVMVVFKTEENTKHDD